MSAQFDSGAKRKLLTVQIDWLTHTHTILCVSIKSVTDPHLVYHRAQSDRYNTVAFKLERAMQSACTMRNARICG